MRIADLMTRSVQACRLGDAMSDAARMMWERDCGCVPVTDASGRVMGMLTDRDICMAAYTTGRPLGEIKVDQAMSRTLVSVHAHDTVETAERLMWEHQIRRLPVVDEAAHLVGIIALNDIARHINPGIGGTIDGLTGEAIALTLAAVSHPRQGEGARR